MAEVVDEVLAKQLEAAQLADHVVEAADQAAHVPGDIRGVHPHGEVPLGHAAHGLNQIVDGLELAPAHARRQRGDEEDQQCRQCEHPGVGIDQQAHHQQQRVGRRRQQAGGDDDADQEYHQRHVHRIPATVSPRGLRALLGKVQSFFTAL